MRVSNFGKKLGVTSGIGRLMDDLALALAKGDDMLMLGGGNPAHIPEVERCFRASMESLLGNTGRFARAIGDYDPPQGSAEFIEAICGLLNEQFGWGLRPENVALTNGSQTAFFILFNLFGGEFEDGLRRKILLPLAPEYIGYCDVGLTDDLFVASRPNIEHIDKHIFKYHVSFEKIGIGHDIGAICLSRPTNPTGNVLTDSEVEKLSELARAHDVPLIIDNAYGIPFPNIVFTEARPVWNENTILCMSLSKLGLPAARTGIVIANQQVISMVAKINAVMSLAPGSLGAAMAAEMVRNREILRLGRDVIRPFYQKKAGAAVQQFRNGLDGLDFHIHKPEGAFFLWLWLRGLPITSAELYERLKKRGVVIVPGHYFFPGLAGPWRHKDECIRVNYSGDDNAVRKGIEIICDEVRRAYEAA
jgi:valine--pyruvate aminotransferase